jgi:hypothetical protein
MLSDETLIRTGVRVYMDTWLANQRDGSQIPVRAGRRMRYIDEVLRPLGERLGESGRNRLRSALAVVLGTEAVIAMKDSAGLDDDEEILATLEWAAGALLRTALQDFEGGHDSLPPFDAARRRQGPRGLQRERRGLGAGCDLGFRKHWYSATRGGGGGATSNS